jgi:hypothetical protein
LPKSIGAYILTPYAQNAGHEASGFSLSLLSFSPALV